MAIAHKARLRAASTLASTILLFTIPAIAHAQSAEDTAAGASADSGDIVVTAQKRSENVQQVPISISAFSQESLQRANIDSVQDLSRVATNFQVGRQIQAAGVRVNVRGIGASGNSAIEPSVAIFLDGVYVPRAGAIVNTMLDMEAVEILRGPQGTLFGRNASVGALSLRTAKPADTFSGRVSAEAGTGDRYKLDGYVNIPLGQNFAFRFAGLQQWFGGLWHNKLDGKQYGGTDETVLRASLGAKFGDVEWQVRADYSRVTGDGYPNIDFDPTSVSAAQLSSLDSRGLLADTNMQDNVMNQVVDANLLDRQWGVSSTLSVDLNGSTIRLINSFRRWRNNQLDGDLSFSPQPILSRQNRFWSDSQNHELQFISPERQWLNGHLDLVAGLYFFKEDYEVAEKFQMRSQFCNFLTPAGATRNACNSFLTTNGGADASDQEVRQTTTSYAAYGQATFHLSDPLSLTLGGRWTRDEKRGTYSQTITNPFIGALRAPEVLTLPNVNDERFTYRISLNYKPTSDVMLFANFSTGYKSGGYNAGGAAPALSTFDANGNLISTARVFGRETVKNYELGIKSQWLDRKLTANLTLYRMDLSGYQDRIRNGTSFTVLNAGNLRHQGFELDLAMAATPRLKVSGALAYLDSKFTDYKNSVGLPGIGGSQDITGKPTYYAPKWSGRVSVDWNGDLGSTGMSWAINTNLSFISEQSKGQVNDANPQTMEPSTVLLGARIALNGPDDKWTLAVFGNNLTDVAYNEANFYQIFDSSFGLRNGVFPGSTGVRRLHAEPRTIGVSGTVRF